MICRTSICDLQFSNHVCKHAKITYHPDFSSITCRFLFNSEEKPGAKSRKLKDACRTCWMQHIDFYVVFLKLLPAVHMALNAIAYPNSFQCLGTDWNWNGETLRKANGFRYQLESSTFAFFSNPSCSLVLQKSYTEATDAKQRCYVCL